MNQPEFTERQPFLFKHFWFVYLITLLPLLLFVYATIQQVILHNRFGDKPAPDWLLIALTIFLAVLLVAFNLTRLEIRLTSEAIVYRWAPFRTGFTIIDWNDVAQADVFEFGYVGAGYRFTPHGTVHTTGGTKGLRLKMRSGKTLILGTQKPAELEAFLVKQSPLRD